MLVAFMISGFHITAYSFLQEGNKMTQGRKLGMIVQSGRGG